MPHVRTKPYGSIQIIYRNPLKKKYEYKTLLQSTPDEIVKAEVLKIEYEIQAHKAGIKVFNYGQEKIDNITLKQ